MNYKLKQTAASFISVLFSFIATSHHWLHMGILMLLGESTNMMATMSGVLWVRRILILMTVVTALFSVYRLYKHKSKEIWIISLTTLSVVLSFFFIINTLVNFGW